MHPTALHSNVLTEIFHWTAPRFGAHHRSHAGSIRVRSAVRITLHGKNFENFIVLAFALVAKTSADAPGSNPGAADSGLQVQILPSARMPRWPNWKRNWIQVPGVGGSNPSARTDGPWCNR